MEDKQILIEKLLEEGRRYHSNGDLKKALEQYSKAENYDKENFEVYNLLGIINIQLKKYENAVKLLNRSLELNNNNADAYFHRALALESIDEVNESLLSLNKSININPKYLAAYIKKGNIMLKLGHYINAIEDFTFATKLDPNHAYAYLAIGCAYMGMKNYKKAIEEFDKSINLEPKMFEAYSNKGNALMEINLINEALVNYNQAIEINKNFAVAYSNRSNPLKKLNKIEDAMHSINTALSIDPELSDAYYNKGTLLLEQNNLKEAIENFTNAINLNNLNINYKYNLSLAMLTNKNLEEGWKLYENRLNLDEFKIIKNKNKFPRWHGIEKINGKTILVTHEQGYGDFIQLYRYSKNLKLLGAKVIFEVPDALIELIEHNMEIDYIIKIGEHEKLKIEIDFTCPIFSLPLAFNTKINDISGNYRYIKAEKNNLIKWEKIYKRNNKIKIGLSWKGNPRHINDKKRSILLKQVIKYLPFNEDTEYYSLQNDLFNEEMELINKYGINSHSHLIENFLDLASILELMDIVITVDTAIAHLAGAIGKDTWLMLPFNPDWRWFLNSQTTPWYDTLLLFRQGKGAKWDSVLIEIRNKILLSIKNKYN